MKQATFLVCAFLVLFQLHSTSYAAPATDATADNANADETGTVAGPDYETIAKETADGSWDDDDTYHSSASSKNPIQNWLDNAGNMMQDKMQEVFANIFGHLIFRDN